MVFVVYMGVVIVVLEREWHKGVAECASMEFCVLVCTNVLCGLEYCAKFMCVKRKG